jgi:hypothetical protein
MFDIDGSRCSSCLARPNSAVVWSKLKQLVPGNHAPAPSTLRGGG